jgi:signal transduction histidine kinase
MTGVGSLRRLEQWMIYIRWLGAALGLVELAIQPARGTNEAFSWALIALLAIGNGAIAFVLRRTTEESEYRRLSMIAFAFDTFVIMSSVWNAAGQEPYMVWAVLFLLPLEGALRFRLRGAMVGAALVALFYVPQGFRVAALRDDPFDIPGYIFIAGLAGLFGGIAGSMAESWHTQREAFLQQSLQLAEIDRLKDRFLAVTSHEIRGPLTAVITGVTTVQRRMDRLSVEQRDRLLDMVNTQAHTLARLVDDLTLTSQLQSGQLHLAPEWTDLEPCVHQALEAAASKRQEHQLHVFVEPLTAEVDASRIGQIVRNLVENAYKYTPSRTKVALTARALDNGVVIKVEDNGPGIPAEKRDQLFEAFSRIEETAAGQEGVGLGLYVVSQLVSAMGGRIDLASSSRGTTFSISIPCPTKSAGERHLGLVKSES